MGFSSWDKTESHYQNKVLDKQRKPNKKPKQTNQTKKANQANNQPSKSKQQHTKKPKPNPKPHQPPNLEHFKYIFVSTFRTSHNLFKIFQPAVNRTYMCSGTYGLNFLYVTASLNCNQMLLRLFEMCTLFRTSKAV